MKEATIKNFPNYKIYENGKIINAKTLKTKSTRTCNKGYLTVNLWKNNTGTNIRVHRLLAEAFIPNKHNLATVNHIDGDKKNNALDNLEWMSYADNNIHAFNSGLRKQQRILSYDDIYNILTSKDSSTVLAKIYNVSSSHINNMKQGNFIESFKLHSKMFKESMINQKRITGISKTKSKKFLATITLPNHKKKSIGCFVTKNEAITTRNNYIDKHDTLSRKNIINIQEAIYD